MANFRGAVAGAAGGLIGAALMGPLHDAAASHLAYGLVTDAVCRTLSKTGYL